jgi:lantibiotic modifying enzyme
VTGISDDAPVLGHGDVGGLLYDGSAGIALGLAAAARAADEAGRQVDTQHWRAVAAGAARTALDGIGAGTPPRGLFDGGTGVAVAAYRVGLLQSDHVLLAQAASAARRCAEELSAAVRHPAADLEPDLISGVAGDILGLLEVDRLTSSSSFLPTAREAARFLAGAGVPQTWGSAWWTGAARAGGPPLLGLGHGAAGIVLALVEVGELTGDDQLRRAAREGLEYERSWYDPDAVNWPDLRQPDPDSGLGGSLRGWCHGALGIGLSRLRISTLTGDLAARAEASAALQAARDEVVAAGSALRQGHPQDATPCHGLAGAVEVFLIAERAFDEPAHARAGRRAAELLVATHDAAGRWPSGLPGAGEVPGLMTGVTGVVLTLLRASGAVQLPTPLLPGPSGW